MWYFRLVLWNNGLCSFCSFNSAEDKLNKQRKTFFKMERYRWEFYGHLLLSLHISLLHISFISSSWTLSTLSGKRCLHLFEDGSGRKENQVLLLYNSNACLPEPDAFSPFLTPALPTVYIIICPVICPVKDDKELGAGGVSLPVSGSMTPFSA